MQVLDKCEALLRANYGFASLIAFHMRFIIFSTPKLTDVKQTYNSISDTNNTASIPINQCLDTSQVIFLLAFTRPVSHGFSYVILYMDYEAIRLQPLFLAAINLLL